MMMMTMMMMMMMMMTMMMMMMMMRMMMMMPTVEQGGITYREHVGDVGVAGIGKQHVVPKNTNMVTRFTAAQDRALATTNDIKHMCTIIDMVQVL